MKDQCFTYDLKYEESLLTSLLSQIESQNEYRNVLLYTGHSGMPENILICLRVTMSNKDNKEGCKTDGRT